MYLTTSEMRTPHDSIIHLWVSFLLLLLCLKDLHPSHSWPQGVNEETLKSRVTTLSCIYTFPILCIHTYTVHEGLIERKQTGRAMKLYQKLKDKGVLMF